MNQSTIAILMLSATGLVAGCQSDKDKCDPGQVLKDAVCIAAAGGAGNFGGTGSNATGGNAASTEGGASAETLGGSASAEGGAPATAGAPGAGDANSTAASGAASGGAAATGGTSSTVSTAELFGKACSADSDCTAPVGYCAKMPGAATGFCTQQGCKADASICPATWTCFDLAAVGVPNGPNFCQKPS